MQARTASHAKVAPPVILSPAMQLAVRRRAGEIYAKSGMIEGRDVQNWMQAETEIRREFGEGISAHNAALVMRVDGVQYVGEYSPLLADGYTPGEFSSGAPVPVRFDGDKMYVKRRNGKELETRIVKRVEC